MESGPTNILPASYRDLYAKTIIAGHLKSLNEKKPLPDRIEPGTFKRHKAGGRASIHVGIIGAGAAGLYAALILDSLGPKISYEILEANPMIDRKGGGRLYTHQFTDGGPNDYYVRIFEL